MSKVVKKNFFKYCYAITVHGKTVLLKVLEWFFKGGDATYAEYLESVFVVENMPCLISNAQWYIMQHKSPQDYDMLFIHNIMRLICDLFEERIHENIEDSNYIVVENEIVKLTLLYLNLSIMRPTLTNDELEDKLVELRKLYEKLIVSAGKLRNVLDSEIQELFKEVRLGVMCLNSFTEKFNPPVVKEKKAVLNEALLKVEKEYEQVIATTKTRNSLTAFTKDLLEDKFKYRIWRRETPLEIIKVKKENADQASKDLSLEKLIGEERLETDGTSCESQDNEVKLNMKKQKKSSSKKSSKKSSMSKKADSNVKGSENVSENFDVKHTKHALYVDEPSNRDDSPFAAIIEDNSMMRAQLYCGLAKMKKLTPQKAACLSLYSDTHVDLKQHQKYSRKPGHQVKLKTLLNVEGMNEEISKIIILSGEAGMGKTLLMKYILQKWRGDENVIEGLQSFNVVLPIELNSNTCSNFHELYLHLINPHIESRSDVQEVQDIILNMPMLITLDGFDESSEKSCQLITNVLEKRRRETKIIITSRPQYVDSLYRLIPKAHRKDVCHLILNGIPSSQQAEFVSHLVDKQVSDAIKMDNFTKEKIKEGLINRLPEISCAMGEDLYNPKLLAMISAMWIENPPVESMRL